MHEPLVFAFPEATFFWIAFVWSFSLEILRSGIVAGAPANTQDAGTLRLINTGSNIALLLAFVASFLPWFIIPYPRIALDSGTGLLAVGSLFRRYCFRILGKYFTTAVTDSADQPVIQDGPYRWIHHPGYAAGFIVFPGIGLTLSNWLSLVLFLDTCFVCSRRIKAEEKVLLDTSGEPYRAYMARTKQFIPFLF